MRLYKYLGPDRTDVLENLKVRFTQAADFNDPFEVLPNIGAVLPPDKVRKYLAQYEDGAKRKFREAVESALSKHRLPPQLADLIPYEVLKAIKLDFASVAELLLPRVVEEHREKFASDVQKTVSERIGILSVSENPRSLLMWAHYAVSHAGFLLEFDSSHEFFNQPKKHERELFRRLLPVTYSIDRPSITMFDPSADSKVWAHRLASEAFLTKSADWAYEQEWRMFLPLDDFASHPHETIGRVHLCDVPADAITAVVIGTRCSDDTRSKIRGMIEASPELDHVEIGEARISATKFEVNIVR